jgi:hypothetical protein
MALDITQIKAALQAKIDVLSVNSAIQGFPYSSFTTSTTVANLPSTAYTNTGSFQQ